MNTCAFCAIKYCEIGEIDKSPANCPCRDEVFREEMKEKYKETENEKIAYYSALVEQERYCEATRLEELISFAQKCNYKKLGLAFCAGFSKEASTLIKILKHHEFSVESVVCKNGSIPKEFIGLTDNQKLNPGAYEAICNPIGQASLLNDAKTDLNIILGLCVGHDSLFIKYSEAPITVLAAKDRVLAHNPVAALYLSDSYYKKKLYK